MGHQISQHAAAFYREVFERQFELHDRFFEFGVLVEFLAKGLKKFARFGDILGGGGLAFLSIFWHMRWTTFYRQESGPAGPAFRYRGGCDIRHSGV